MTTGDVAIGFQPVHGTMDVSSVIGDYGPFQRGVFMFCLLRGIPVGLHVLVSSFFLPTVEHWCARPEGLWDNLTVDQWRNTAIPVQKTTKHGEDVSGLNGCSMYAVLQINSSVLLVDRNETHACTKWEYGEAFYKVPVVEEWNLVCGDAWLRSLVQSTMMWGMLVGSAACTAIGDMVGRRPPIIASIALTLTAGIATGLVPSFGLFLACRAVLGFGLGLGQGSSFCLLMEVIGPKQRTTTALAYSVGFAVGLLALPGFAWAFQEWRHLQLAITAPLLIFLVWSWFLPESPRWLVVTGKMKRARAVIMLASKANGIPIEDMDSALSQLRKKILMDKASEHISYLDLVRTAQIRRYTAIFLVGSFTTGIGFYGLQLSVTHLGGDPYVSFLIAAAIEFPVGLACYIVVRFFSRRRAALATYLVSGMCCLGILFTGHHLVWLRLSFAMLGKFTASVVFTLIWIFAAEVFPTVLRTEGVGACMMATRTGAAVAPFLVEMRSYTVEAVPMAILAGVFALAGLLVTFLPETFRVVLPDTVKETEDLRRNRTEDKSDQSTTVVLLSTVSTNKPDIEPCN